MKIRNANGNIEVIADVAGCYYAHDHDDRYYTKAEVDAPSQHVVSIPIGALATEPGMKNVVEDTAGLHWTNDYPEAAVIHIARPGDRDGTSNVVLRLLFRTTSASASSSPARAPSTPATPGAATWRTITIQRNPGHYTDLVIVAAVTLNYTG